MVTEVEKILRRIFKDQNNSLGTSDAQILREYQFDPHSIFHLTETVEQKTLRSLPALLPVLIALKFFACRTFHCYWRVLQTTQIHRLQSCSLGDLSCVADLTNM